MSNTLVVKSMSKLSVKLIQSTYDIYIQHGILEFVQNYLDVMKPTLVITDDVVAPLYLEKLSSKIPTINFYSYVIKHGETSKTFEEAKAIIDYLIQEKCTKDIQIIALGGGVVGDLAGFVASIYLRGVDFIQIPTTLLSQVDSSIGGKVAVNVPTMKNAVGSFYQPKLVLIDPSTLLTLPQKEFRSGMAEIIKIAALLDQKFFYELKAGIKIEAIEGTITKALKLKKKIVEMDPFDQSIRQILNFGHTIGHAIEAHYNYKKYTHGEAVAIGMVKITSDPIIKQELIDCLLQYNLPINDPYNGKELFDYILKDKKVSNKSINVILLETIGSHKIERMKLVDFFNLL